MHARIAWLFLLVLVLTSSCRPEPGKGGFELARFGGERSPQTQLFRFDSGVFGLAGTPWTPRNGALLAAVVESEEGAHHVAAVLQCTGTRIPCPLANCPLTGFGGDQTHQLLVVSAAGRVAIPGSETYLYLDELPESATGLSLAQVGADNPELAIPITSQLTPGWFWVVRAEGATVVPSLSRFAKGLVMLDVDGAVVARIGDIGSGDALVGIPPSSSGRGDAARILLRDNGDGAMEALGEALRTRAELLGLRVDVVVALEEVEMAPEIDVRVEVRDGEAMYSLRASPEAFAIPPLGDRPPLGVPSILRQPLRVPVATGQEAVADLVLGVAALKRPRDPLAVFLLERLVPRGLQFAGSTLALQWRLSELYALAGHTDLAHELVAFLGGGSVASQADAMRYQARVEHMSLTSIAPQDVERVDRLYETALRAYLRIDFAGGVADALRQRASLHVAAGRWEEARALSLDAAEAFERASLDEHASETLERLALDELFWRSTTTGPPSGPDVEQLLARAIELTSDPQRVIRLGAWRATVTEDPSVTAKMVEQLSGGELHESLQILVEANVERLSGRTSQARASLLDAARVALEAGDSTLFVVASGLALQASRIALSDDPAAPGLRRHILKTTAQAHLALQAKETLAWTVPPLRALRLEACALASRLPPVGGEHSLVVLDACLAAAGANDSPELRLEAFHEAMRLAADLAGDEGDEGPAASRRLFRWLLAPGAEEMLGDGLCPALLDAGELWARNAELRDAGVDVVAAWQETAYQMAELAPCHDLEPTAQLTLIAAQLRFGWEDEAWTNLDDLEQQAGEDTELGIRTRLLRASALEQRGDVEEALSLLGEARGEAVISPLLEMQIVVRSARLRILRAVPSTSR